MTPRLTRPFGAGSCQLAPAQYAPFAPRAWAGRGLIMRNKGGSDVPQVEQIGRIRRVELAGKDGTRAPGQRLGQIGLVIETLTVADDLLARVAGRKDPGADGLTIVMPLGLGLQRSSGSFPARCSDNQRWWVKALKHCQMPRVAVNEFLVGRLGALIASPVCQVSTVRIGWEFRAGHLLEEGIHRLHSDGLLLGRRARACDYPWRTSARSESMRICP